eukprot:NP_001041256.1 F-box A protein [Caenorhabditis elegans]
MCNISSKTQKGNLISCKFPDVPFLVANLILQKLEPIDLLTVRKVCRSLRACVDKLKSHFDTILLDIRKDHIDLILDGNWIRYRKRGSTVTYKGHKKQIKGDNFMETAFKDLKTSLKHVSKLEIYYCIPNRYDVFASFIDFLKSKKFIHSEMIVFHKFPFDDVISILPYFDAQTLETIELCRFGSLDQFERIIYLDQWRNAKTFKFENSYFCSKLLVHLFHFQCFYINEMLDFTTQVAVKIRDDLMRRSTFQCCQIYFEKSDSMELAKVFKPDYTGGIEFNIEFSDDNLNFLVTCSRLHFDSFIFSVKRL